MILAPNCTCHWGDLACVIQKIKSEVYISTNLNDIEKYSG